MGKRMHHVVVSAGAVGVAYADALLTAGHDVTFFVRPKYVDEVKAGIRFYKDNGKGDGSNRKSRVVKANNVISTFGELRERHVDALWLTVPGTAFDDEPWLEAMLESAPDATIVEFAGGIDSGQKIHSRVDKERIVEGLISFMAWQSPLPDRLDGDREPGISFWCPPGPESLFSGPRAQILVDALREGGLMAKFHDDVPGRRAFGSALLSAFVIALELADWKFSGAVGKLGRGSIEALTVIEKERGTRAGPLKFVAHPFVFGAAAMVVPVVAPVPVEAFFAYHFKKVGAQMHGNLHGILARARKHGLATPDLDRMAKALEGRASSSSSSVSAKVAHAA